LAATDQYGFALPINLIALKKHCEMNEVSLLVHSLRLLEGEEFSKLYGLEDCTKVERDKGFFFNLFIFNILFGLAYQGKDIIVFRFITE